MDMVCQNLRHAYLLEVGVMQITTYHETLSIVYHVETHVDFSSMIISLGPRPSPSSVNLDGLDLFNW